MFPSRCCLRLVFLLLFCRVLLFGSIVFVFFLSLLYFNFFFYSSQVLGIFLQHLVNVFIQYECSFHFFFSRPFSLVCSLFSSSRALLLLLLGLHHGTNNNNSREHNLRTTMATLHTTLLPHLYQAARSSSESSSTSSLPPSPLPMHDI